MEQEKTYKVMRGTGATCIASGIISIITGVTIGILLIVSGAVLLSQKKKVMF